MTLLQLVAGIAGWGAFAVLVLGIGSVIGDRWRAWRRRRRIQRWLDEWSTGVRW